MSSAEDAMSALHDETLTYHPIAVFRTGAIEADVSRNGAFARGSQVAA